MNNFLSKLALAIIISFQSVSIFGQDDKNQYILNLSLEDLINSKVFVASNVISDIRKQPASITTISKKRIRLSGARTLNELLTTFVPGYFLVEDQDDSIAGFRGLVPDNNSKVMLLLNGVSLNTEWFWGAPDAILNGLDIDFIERIEVIRGPGSVTLGQGALLGVINIVTTGDEQAKTNLTVNQGKDGLKKYTLDINYNNENTNIYAYFSKGRYEGQELRNEGWANIRKEQGLTVYERQHRLKRSEYTNILGNIRHRNIELDLYHFNQSRDLYNFYRDREVVKQTINGIAGHYNYEFNEQIKLKFTARFTRDDYGLFSHGLNLETQERFAYESSQSGFSDIIANMPDLANSRVESGVTMGGTREERHGAKLLINWNDIWEGNRLAFGMEYVEYHYGLSNSNGHNFIINEEVQRLGLTSNNAGGFEVRGSLNENNTWVKPGNIAIRSLFLENFYSISNSMDLFAAFRFDDHPSWGAHISPRLGGFYEIDNNHLFRVTWQTGFRGAVGVQFAGGFVQDGFLAQENFALVNEMSESNADFNFDGIAANDTKNLTAVEPETIESVELAYSFTENNFKFNSVLFFNTIEDILTAEANGYEGLAFGDPIGSDTIGTWNGNWYYQNQAGQLKQLGFELEFEYEIDHLILTVSHAHVEVTSADPDTIGIYVLANEKNAAYPEDINRVHLRYDTNSATGAWALHYNHLYYWGYGAPTGESVSGNHIASAGVSWSPYGLYNSLSFDFVIKNIWNEGELYPINGTGDIAGAKGTPALESRTWWLGLKYTF